MSSQRLRATDKGSSATELSGASRENLLVCSATRKVQQHPPPTAPNFPLELTSASQFFAVYLSVHIAAATALAASLEGASRCPLPSPLHSSHPLSLSLSSLVTAALKLLHVPPQCISKSTHTHTHAPLFCGVSSACSVLLWRTVQLVPFQKKYLPRHRGLHGNTERDYVCRLSRRGLGDAQPPEPR